MQGAIYSLPYVTPSNCHISRAVEKVVPCAMPHDTAKPHLKRLLAFLILVDNPVRHSINLSSVVRLSVYLDWEL
jgi:hypothetical protein